MDDWKIEKNNIPETLKLPNKKKLKQEIHEIKKMSKYKNLELEDSRVQKIPKL